MGMSDKTLVRLVLILIVVWIAINIAGELVDVFGQVVNLATNSVIGGLLVILLILWYLDYI
ncbi:MAG: hypothetical protein ACLFMT_04055 [Halobacteriales archaeon]